MGIESGDSESYFLLLLFVVDMAEDKGLSSTDVYFIEKLRFMYLIISCDLGSNRGPLDLQSYTLPTELSPLNQRYVLTH